MNDLELNQLKETLLKEAMRDMQKRSYKTQIKNAGGIKAYKQQMRERGRKGLDKRYNKRVN